MGYLLSIQVRLHCNMTTNNSVYKYKIYLNFMNNILKKSITKSSICQISKKRLSKSCVENCWTNSITKSAQNAYMYVGYWRVPAVLRGSGLGCWEREIVAGNNEKEKERLTRCLVCHHLSTPYQISATIFHKN